MTKQLKLPLLAGLRAEPWVRPWLWARHDRSVEDCDTMFGCYFAAAADCPLPPCCQPALFEDAEHACVHDGYATLQGTNGNFNSSATVLSSPPHSSRAPAVAACGAAPAAGSGAAVPITSRRCPRRFAHGCAGTPKRLLDFFGLPDGADGELAMEAAVEGGSPFARDWGSVLLDAAALAHFWRFAGGFRAQLQRRVRAIEGRQLLRQGCVAVHVRHGDKCRDAPCFPFRAYMAAAGRLRARYGCGALALALALTPSPTDRRPNRKPWAPQPSPWKGGTCVPWP
jgi:hypothetical protein